jgi:hypothetical protein
MPAKLVRHLVLDNEAAQALASSRAHDRRRASVVTAIMAANGKVVVPTAVRMQAGWRRRDPASAGANQLVSHDVPLDGVDADRAVQLRRLAPSSSVVDATVVVAAERVATDTPCTVVEVLTSDVPDIEALATHSEARITVVSL